MSDRETLTHLVAAVVPCDAIEAAHQADVVDWIASGVDIYRLQKPATPPKHLVVYAVILDAARGHVFLIDHRKARRWLPTGGHVDPGEHPFTAARRELLEETGAKLPALSEAPLLLTVTDVIGSGDARHTDVTLWYGFTASMDASFALDAAECAQGAWFGAGMLSSIACEVHLPRFMAKIGRWRHPGCATDAVPVAAADAGFR